MATVSIIQGAARLLFGKLLPKWPYPIVRGPLRGTRFILGAAGGEAGGVSTHFGLVEPRQVESLLETLKPGQVFFDVGANVGYYTLLASHAVGPKGLVVSLEPVIRNVAFLHRHIALNRLDNVLVLPTACSDRLSLARFASGINFATGSLTGDGAMSSWRESSLVMTVSLDAVVEKLGRTPDVMKIDVEGAELNVLRGADSLLDKARPTIFLSVHSDGLRDQCSELLRQRGYEMLPLDHAEFGVATEFRASHPKRQDSPRRDESD